MRHLIIKHLFNISRYFFLIWVGIVFPFSPVVAETVKVTLLELQQALDNANSGTDAVARDVFARISEAINDSDLGLVNGELIYRISDENMTVEGGCNRTVILQIDTDITLNSDTSVSLSLDSLYDPVVISLNVNANITSAGEARQILGVRLGQCQNIARDSFDFLASGPASFDMQVTLLLNPEWTDETTLSLFPKVILAGELTEFSVDVDVDDTVLAGILESYIEDQIDDTFSNSRLVQELSDFEAEVNASLYESFENGRIDIELPEATDEQIIALYQFLQPEARFPITLDMIRANRQKILSSMLFGEPSSAQNIFSDALVCESASAFLNTTESSSLFDRTGNQCSAVNLAEAMSGNYWSDEQCTDVIDYRTTSMSEHCIVALDADRLGNASVLGTEAQHWTHSPGTRFDIGALSLDGLAQPLMRRYRYKSVQTDRGLCELEMRVYSGASHIESRKPLLALHGGSWQHRASGFLGIEATATHFTNRGFVVFAPFYRLIGESDGNAACNNATLSDIQSDVNDALDWVNERSEHFRLNDKTTVFGQSAGGHLALSLAVGRSNEIRRAILFYAPTDFADFAAQIKSGAYTNPAGLKILQTVTGETIDELDTSSLLVSGNSFPAIVSATPERYPPMFILHGEMDSLLPFRQSVRLCNALSGSSDPNLGPAELFPNIDSLSSSTACGISGSTLHLIAEGEHALDLCLAPGLCLSGSEQSSEEVARSMTTMLDWASAERVSVSAIRVGAGGGLGATHWLLLVLVTLVWLSRKILSIPRVSSCLQAPQ